jgi:hypothetical protein
MSIIPELIKVCLEEWVYFGMGKINHLGYREGGLNESDERVYLRVGEYWKVVTKNYDGRDYNEPWSGVFISYCMKKAGAGEKFNYSASHSTFIKAAINNALKGVQDAPIVGRRIAEYSPKVGDLIGYWRDPPVTFDTATKLDSFKSHTDVVIELHPGFAYVIGGNVEDSVRRRYVKLDQQGRLIDDKKDWFVIIQNNM